MIFASLYLDKEENPSPFLRLFINHTTCVHQGKEEINLPLAFLYLCHSRLEAAPTNLGVS
jgi:hypothetical protein